MSKAYCLPFDYLLHEVSYANIQLYASVIPSYTSDKDKKGSGAKTDTDVIKADDPRNKDRVNQFFESIKD